MAHHGRGMMNPSGEIRGARFMCDPDRTPTIVTMQNFVGLVRLIKLRSNSE